MRKVYRTFEGLVLFRLCIPGGWPAATWKQRLMVWHLRLCDAPDSNPFVDSFVWKEESLPHFDTLVSYRWFMLSCG